MNFASSRVDFDAAPATSWSAPTDVEEDNPFGATSFDSNSNNPYAGLFSRPPRASEKTSEAYDTAPSSSQKEASEYDYDEDDEKQSDYEKHSRSYASSEYEEETLDSDDEDDSSVGDELSSAASTVVDGSTWWEELTDYRLIVGMGICLLVVAIFYFYWLSVQCHVEENEQMLLTTQYALDKKSYKMVEDFEEIPNTTEVLP